MFERHLATLLPEQQQHSCAACNYNMLAYIHTYISLHRQLHALRFWPRPQMCARYPKRPISLACCWPNDPLDRVDAINAEEFQ